MPKIGAYLIKILQFPVSYLLYASKTHFEGYLRQFSFQSILHRELHFYIQARPAGYFDKVNLSQRTTQKLRRINKEISPGDKHISRLPLERGSLLNKNAYSMVCFSAAMCALLPENASPYLIIDLIPNACISAL